MSSKRNPEVSHKVGEIQRMQKNWMDQRATVSQTGERSSELRSRGNHSSKGGGGNNKPPSIPETLSWIVGSGPKNKPSSMRARSASPARTNNAARPSSGSINTRPFSGKANAGSRPPSSERPPPSNRLVSSRSDSSTAKKVERSTRVDQNASKGRLIHAGSEPLLYRSQQNESSRPSARSEANGKITDQWDFSNGKPNSQSERSTKTAVQSETPYSVNNQSESRVESSGQSHESYFTQFMARTRELLGPDAFAKLSEQIASNANLKPDRSQMMESVGFTGKSVLDDDQEKNETASNHKCSKCKQLMVAPDHTPYVLIPCAHTLCEACAENRIKCPTCRTKVTSTAVNATLQQVIISAQGTCSSVAPGKPNTQSECVSRPTYDPTDYSSCLKHPAKTQGSQQNVKSLQPAYEPSNTGRIGANGGAEPQRRRISPEEHAQMCLDEYQNLAIRCEAVETEEKDIIAAVEGKNREIAKQKKQIANIVNEQDRLREEVRKIEERIAALDTHRREYEQLCEQLEDDRREKKDRLDMVRDMRRGLEKRKQKVKMLSREITPLNVLK